MNIVLDMGTKVLVNSKSTGCDIQRVFNRVGNSTPKSLPFFGYVVNYKGNSTYAIGYEQDKKSGGDYYTTSDFKVIMEEYFKDEEFMI